MTVEGVSKEYIGELALDLGVDIEGLEVGLGLESDWLGMMLPARASWAKCFRYIFFLFC